MSGETRALAFDLGASNGRGIVGIYDGQKIHLEEVARFANEPVKMCDTLYWDVLRLWHEMQQGMRQAARFGEIASLAVDTWGVDFALLDATGHLLANPVHYRDQRTADILPQVFTKISREALYMRTGNQIMPINTAFQLCALQRKCPEIWKQVRTLLMLPDFFHYLLTGVKKTEWTIATTSQLIDQRKKVWATDVMHALGIPRDIFTDIVPPATPIGNLSNTVAKAVDMKKIPVVAVAGHDTQCAMVAIPARAEPILFLSAGTWFLLGTETTEPIINDHVLRANFTNEGAYGGKNAFLQNLTGLWLAQSCRRQWQREGKHVSFTDLEKLAWQAKPLQCFIATDAADLLTGENIPQKIKTFCRRTGQAEPQTMGAIMRTLYENLALRCRHALEDLKACTGQEYKVLHVIGGGSQSRLLCTCLANACQLPVIAGPVEATAMGNLALQYIADGALANLTEARNVIRASTDLSYYEPQESNVWQRAYETWRRYASC